MIQPQKRSLFLAILILLLAQALPAREIASASFMPEESEMLNAAPAAFLANMRAQPPRAIQARMLMDNWSVDGDQAGAAFGYAVSDAGDVNGDGYADVIVGAPYYGNGQAEEGRAYIYYGSAAGLATGAGWVMEINQAGALFGASVSAAGDVNGDGFADVIVGAPGYTNGQAQEGRVYIYFGSSAGLATTAGAVIEGNLAGAQLGSVVGAAGDVNGDGYDDVILGAPALNTAWVYRGSATGLATPAAWSVQNAQSFAEFGGSVGTAGDVNGDGYDDVIVGAPLYDNDETNEGAAFVFLGSETGLSIIPAWSAEGNQSNAWFGGSVGTAGDVNGDGFADVLIGASNYSNGQSGEGRAFVFHGSAAGLAPVADWAQESDSASAAFGLSTDAAGDVNADGFDDVLVGAPFFSNGETSEGRAFVYLGSPAGLAGVANWMTEGNQAEAYLGIAVSAAGDVNGDDFADILLGASNYSNAGVNGGRALVYEGDFAPVANAGADQTVATLATVTLDGSASSDANGDPLTYHWTQTGGASVALSDAAAVSTTFTAPSDPDTLTFALVVADNRGLTSTADAVTITVTNQAPVADAGSDQGVIPSAQVSLAGGGSDPDGDTPLSFLWIQTGGTSVALSDAKAAAPTFTAPADIGPLTFTLTVTDRLGLADPTPDEVVVHVTHPPVPNAGPDQTVFTLSPVTLDGSASSDPDGDLPIGSYHWTQTGGTAVTFDDPTLVNPTFTTPSDPGTLTFSLSVSDSLGCASVTVDEVTITIKNQAPSANAGPDQSVDTLSTVTLDAGGSTDIDEDLPLSYYWVETSNAGITLSDADGAQPTFTAPSDPAVLRFSLYVWDSRGLIDATPDEVVITVNNQAPTSDAGENLTVYRNSTVTLSANDSEDPDGDLPLSYYWEQISGPQVVLSSQTAALPRFTSPAEPAVLVFSVIVTDSLGLQSAAADTATITVVNRAPTPNAGADQGARPNSTVTLDGSDSYDQDGDLPLTYSWLQTGGPTVTLSDPTSATPTFTAPGEITTLTFILFVSDSRELSSPSADEVVIHVSGTPVANAGADQTVNTNAWVWLDGSASSDPDGDALTYRWTQTGGLEIDLDDPTSMTPIFRAPSDPTTVTLALVVTDVNGVSSSADAVNITINNQAPLAEAGSNRSVNTLSTVTLNAGGSSDPDGDTPFTYLWSQTGGPDVTLSDATAAAPSFTAPSDPATLTFSLTVTDSLGLASAPDGVTITILNQAPVANAGLDQSVATLSSVTLDGSASSDPDGDTPLSYRWTQTGGAAVALSSASASAPSFTAPSDPATLTFSLVVTDSLNRASTADSVTITINNQAPAANAGADQSVATLSSVTLDGSGSSDPDGDTPLSYRWTQTGGAAVALNDVAAAAPTFSAPSDPATLTFSLVVTDSLGLDSAADEVTVTVNNQAPLAQAGPDQTITTETLVTLNGSASADPDGDTPLAFLWSQTGGPDVTLSDATAAAPTFTPPAGPAALTFALVVTDSLGQASAPDEVIVTINNQLPVAHAGSNRTVPSLSAVTLDGSQSSDPDGHLPLTYRWTQTGGTSVTLDDPSAVQPTFTAPAQAGDLTFSLVVKDSLGSESAPDEVIITISNQAPVANAGANQFVATLALVTLDGNLSSDPDGNLPLTYLWTQTGGTPVTLDDPTAVQPTFTAPSESATLTFALVVRDSLGATSTVDEVVITVQGCYLYIPFVMR